MSSGTPTLNQTLTTPELYVLLAVTDKTLHGYGIRSQVAEDSSSQLILAIGTVYPLLDRLAARGWLDRVVADGERGIVARYHITPAGRECLQIEVRRLERIAVQARYKLTGRV